MKYRSAISTLNYSDLSKIISILKLICTVKSLDKWDPTKVSQTTYRVVLVTRVPWY